MRARFGLRSALVLASSAAMVAAMVAAILACSRPIERPGAETGGVAIVPSARADSVAPRGEASGRGVDLAREVDAGAAASPAASTLAARDDAGLVEPPAARPCEVIVEPRGAGHPRECFELDRVQPEGHPLSVCVEQPQRLVFVFDAQGRVLEGPGVTYEHGHGGAAKRKQAGRVTRVRFDASGRLVEDGPSRRRHDAAGRLLRVDDGKHFVEYVYAPDGTYTTRHNYPDRDEFCLSDRVEVRRDERGRPAVDRHEHCEINETPRTLHYRYDVQGRLERIEIDVGSDGSIDAELRLRFGC